MHGIGGVFFRARDPKALARWYETTSASTLRQVITRPGRGSSTPDRPCSSQFPHVTNYFGRAEQAWMINFRVRDLNAMVAQLQAAGIEVERDPKEYPNGRFARLHDLEGNPIELWEPVGQDAPPD